MAILDEKKARDEVSKGNARNFYYLAGDEPYKIMDFIELLKIKILPDGVNSFNFEQYYGDELSVENFLDNTNSFSLWQGKKIILVKNADAITAKNWERLASLLENPPEHLCVLFWARKLDQRLKHIQQINRATNGIVLLKFEAVKDQELPQWIHIMAKQLGKSVDSEAVALLQEWTGTSLFDIRQILEKAAIYAGDALVLGSEHIRAVSVRTRPETIFAFTDAVLTQNRTESLQQLSQLLVQGEDPIALLALLGRQYRWLLVILALKAEGRNESAIVSELKLFPRVAQNLFAAAKRMGGQKVMNCLRSLVDADVAMKSTREPSATILERVTLQLITK